MSDSGRDWGASSDESIRAFNAAKRDAKIENAIKQLDSLHAATSTVIVENRFTPESPRCMSAFIAEIYESWPTISDELKRLRACKIDGMTVDDLNRLRQMIVDANAARADLEKALNASEERVAELLRENSELEGWKCSAIEAFARWDKCHVAAGSPAKPGECTSEATEREILRLRSFEHGMHSGETSIVGLRGENERLQQQVAELNANLDTEKRAAISIASAALSTGCVKPESKGTVEAVNDMAEEISRLRAALRELLDANGPCSNIAARTNARNVLGDK